MTDMWYGPTQVSMYQQHNPRTLPVQARLESGQLDMVYSRRSRSRALQYRQHSHDMTMSQPDQRTDQRHKPDMMTCRTVIEMCRLDMTCMWFDVLCW
jgi:hypothetical protein